MTRKSMFRPRRAFLGAVLLAATVGLATPAAAASTCVRTGDTLDVNLDGENVLFEQFTLRRTVPGDIELTRSALLSTTTIDCGDATTTNVNTINVSGTSAIERFGIAMEFGGFRPGQTLEGAVEESEIEISVNLGGSNSDAATLAGTGGADDLVMGAKGVNVNDDDDGNDIRFGASVELPGMSGDDGADRLRASGGSATGGPAVSPVLLVGGVGQDVLRGGAAGDYITGGDDMDLITGGAGNDRLGADASPLTQPPMTEAGNDIIRGGSGGDVLRGGLDQDRLDGGSGDDEEHGGDAADVFLQGARPNGADHLVGGSAQDEVLYEDRGGRVEVSLDNKRNDGASGERDSVGFKRDIEDVSGGRGNDVLKGNKNDNVLAGLDGDDRLVGKAGTDTCLGGPGTDVLKTCE